MRVKSKLGKCVPTRWVLVLLMPLCCLVSAVPAFAQFDHDLIAEDDEVFIPTIQPVIVNVLNNDVDTLGHDLIVTQVTTAAFGTVVIDPGAKTITYTPGAGFVEDDIFTYEVSDGEVTAFASVTVSLGIATPPRSTKGSYDGLIQGIAGPIGAIRVNFATNTNASKFTGSARFAGKTIRFKGSLANGTARVALPRGGSLELTLIGGPSFNTLIGEIVQGGVIGDFTASQFTYGVQALAPQLGKYTLVADNDPNNFPTPEFPQGATWAKATISKAGLIRIRGRLGDGKVLSASAVVRETLANPSGEASLFVAPYARRSGVFSGVLTFADTADPQKPDFEGTLQWNRPAAAKSAYASGFALNVSLIGARFNAPRGTSALNWADTINQGQAFTDDGNQPNDVLKKLVTLAGINKVNIDDPGADKLKLQIKADGVVTGSFVIDGQRTPTRMTGVVIQKFGGIIEGQFRGRGQTRALDQIGWFGVFPGRDNKPTPPDRAAL